VQSPDREQSEPMYGSELPEVRSGIARTIMRSAAERQAARRRMGIQRIGRDGRSGADATAAQSKAERGGAESRYVPQ